VCRRLRARQEARRAIGADPLGPGVTRAASPPSASSRARRTRRSEDPARGRSPARSLSPADGGGGRRRGASTLGACVFGLALFGFTTLNGWQRSGIRLLL